MPEFYLVTSSGELEEKKILSYEELDSTQIYLIIVDQEQIIYIWRGVEAPNRMKFLSSRSAAQFRVDRGGTHSVRSVDQDQEHPHFQDLFEEKPTLLMEEMIDVVEEDLIEEKPTLLAEEMIGAIKELDEEPVEEVFEEIAEKIGEEEVKVPVEEVTEIPEIPEITLDETAEPPAEPSVEIPAEEPVEIPAEEPVEIPAEEPVEIPAEEPAEIPAEEPVEIPAEEPVEIPAEPSVEEPAEMLESKTQPVISFEEADKLLSSLEFLRDESEEIIEEVAEDPVKEIVEGTIERETPIKSVEPPIMVVEEEKREELIESAERTVTAMSENLADALKEYSVPNDYIREFIISHNQLFTIVRTEVKLLGVKEERLEPMKKLPDGARPVEGYLIRLLVKNGEVIAVEFLRKLQKIDEEEAENEDIVRDDLLNAMQNEIKKF